MVMVWFRRSLIALALVLLFAFAMLLSGSGSEVGPAFTPYARWLTIAAGLSVGLLVSLLIERGLSLWSDLTRGAPGAGLRLRLLGFLLALALPPWLLLFGFSLRLIDAAMDSWFQVDVNRSLEAALDVARGALDTESQQGLAKLRDLRDAAERRSAMAVAIESPEVMELSEFDQQGRVVETQSSDPAFLLPQEPPTSLRARAREADGLAEFRATPVRAHIFVLLPLTGEGWLQGRYALRSDWSAYSQQIEAETARFQRITFLREALKTTIWLVLGVVMLLGLLLTFFLAFAVARRLVAPISELIDAAQRIGSGDLYVRVAERKGSELGALGNAFNRMGVDLADAQQKLALAVQAAEAERASLAAVQQRMSSGVLTLDRHERVVGMNGSAAQMLGLDRETVRGLTLEQMGQEVPDMKPLCAALREPIATGNAEFKLEVSLRKSDAQVPFLLRGARLPEPIGGTVIVFDDLGEVGRAQRETAWREVARRLAHEIKNPLTPIQLAAERLRRRYLGKLPDDDRDVLDRATNTIVAQVEALKTMVNAFSEYAQAPQLVLKPLALDALVKEVTQLYESAGSPVHFELILDQQIPALRGDSGRLRQLLHNLIRNSEEAAAPQPVRVQIRLAVVAVDAGQALDVTVSDNGPGLPAELQSRVFEPYVSSKPKGTGLGLAIVKRIVEEHGGQIRAENQAHGGACFRIRLPIA